MLAGKIDPALSPADPFGIQPGGSGRPYDIGTPRPRIFLPRITCSRYRPIHPLREYPRDQRRGRRQSLSFIKRIQRERFWTLRINLDDCAIFAPPQSRRPYLSGLVQFDKSAMTSTLPPSEQRRVGKEC